MLNRHPDIACLPETHFFSAPRMSQPGRQLTSRELGRLESVIARNTALDLLDINWADVAGKVRKTDRYPVRVLEEIMKAYAREEGAALCGEKTPGHLEHVSTILDYCPRAKIIGIVRDPRAVVASVRKTPWGKSPPRYIAWAWLKAMRRMVKLRGCIPSSQFTLVRYEDLVTKPEATLREVCAFLGRTFDPVMLRPGSHDERLHHDGKWSWVGNIGRPVFRSSLDSYRDSLAPADCRFIEVVTRRMRQHLGYDVEGKHTLPVRCTMWGSMGLQLANRVRYRLLRVCVALRHGQGDDHG